jgi:hypothetical protein
LQKIIQILDLSQRDPSLAGFSSIFTSGAYLFLVPYRNNYEPKNGQRGHGNVVRVELNNFNLNGVVSTDVSVGIYKKYSY